MSRTVKLVIMGAGAAALLYSCAPGIGGSLGALPYLWFLSNPFYRPQAAATCPPGTPNCEPQGARAGAGSGGTGSSVTRSGGSSGSTVDAPSASSTTSQRGGFGGSAGSYGSSGAT
jgi:hypothetical protein